MTDQARFYIDVPFSSLDQIEVLLNSNGVQFSPVENMVALPKANLLDGIFTGAEAQEAVDKINEYLEGEDRAERLPAGFHNLSPETRHDLLEFITFHVDWENDFSVSLLEVNEGELTKFLQNHPVP